MPNTNPCPTCHAQLDPGTPHTFCARTKEPKARELDARIKSLGRAFDVLQKDGQDDRNRIEALEKQSRDITMLRSVDHARLEALERDRSDRGALATKLKDLAYEHADTLTLTELRDLFDVAANHENTGAARGDGSERQPSDSHGSPAPDKGGCGTKHGEPSTQALGELRSVEACGKAPVTVAYTEHGGGGHAAQSARNETTEQSVAQPPSAAASALPMPERPDDLDEPWLERHFMCDSINLNEERNGNVRSAEAARLYALSLESRLAAAENTNTKQGVGGTTAVSDDSESLSGSERESALPADSPSPATAFEMTEEQRAEFWKIAMEWRDKANNGHPLVLHQSARVTAYVTDLVRSELRKAREGWVTREVAMMAKRCCPYPPFTHNSPADCLDSAIRAASKEADSFRAGSSPND